MTREEAVALLERYSNYDGIGIPNLAGCKEAMKVAVDALKEAFPELAESEDERIRKAIIEHFKQSETEFPGLTFGGYYYSDVLVYLEKQKEQKPAEPSDDELQRYQDELYNFKVFAAKQAKEHHISFVHDFEWNNFCAELLSYFNEKQKPWEWSEEDEKIRQSIIKDIEFERNYTSATTDKADNVIGKYNEQIAWLKFLKPSWKPTEHQMNILKAVKDYVGKGSGYWGEGLGSLIDDLEKLM